ncbi:MAG: hypothetical protein ABSC51_01795 [Gaiellaceae bacterium]|jgi:hypothetical protein
MKKGRALTTAEESAEMHLRIMVEQAVRCGKSEREIEALLRQVEADDQEALRRQAEENDREALGNWQLPRAA